MDEDDNKKVDKAKKRRQEFGVTVAKFIRYGKYLANPAVLYALAIIAIIVLIIGIISFIISMPGEILGQIANVFNNIFGNKDINSLEVTDKEILDLAKYLEEMGYDLEGYGFVESITLKDEPTYSDQDFKEEGIPSKGEIKEIKSKYLKAYLVAEKKTYVKANKTYSAFIISNESMLKKIANRQHRKILMDKIFDDFIWPEDKEMPQYIRDAVNKIYTYSNGNYSMNQDVIDLLKEEAMYNPWGMDVSGVPESFYNSSYEHLTDSNIREKIKKIVVGLFGVGIDSTYGHDNWEKDDFNVVTSKKITKNNYWDINESNGTTWTTEFEGIYGIIFYTNYLGDDKKAWMTLLNLYTALDESYDASKTNGGMLWFETNDSVKEENGEFWKSGDTTYEYHIELENRLLRIDTQLTDTFWRRVKRFFGVSDVTGYLYDLNNWTTKYGKPTEFLIAVHLATQAPEFAYKLATEYDVDTQVHIAAFESDINIKFVLGDKSEDTLLGAIEEANTNSEYVETFKKILYREIENGSNFNRNYGEYLNWFMHQTTGPGLYEASTAPNIDTNLGITLLLYIPPEIDDDDMPGYQARCKYLVYEKNTLEGLYKLAKDMFASIDFIKKEEYKFIELPGIDGITFSVYDLFGKEQIKETITEWESDATKTIQPYITKVEKHWYRNQYFTDIPGLGNLDARTEALANQYGEVLYRIFLIVYEEDFEKYETAKKLYDSGMTEYEEDAKKLEEAYTKLKEKVEKNVEAQKENIRIHLINKNFNKYIDNLLNNTETFKNLPQEKFNRIKKELEAWASSVDYANSAYQVEVPEPTWYTLKSLVDRGADSGDLKTLIDNYPELLEQLAIKETRDKALVQVHNPLFEDNSRFVRKWLKDKYIIFDGSTDNTAIEKSGQTISERGETKGETLNKKIGEEKKFINGKTALQEIENEIAGCDARSDMIYLLRDLKELFQDFEFDFEQYEDENATKCLSNIMPEYKPYTPWPSVYETAEENCTKIIYKTVAVPHLVLPANGSVKELEAGKKFEIEFKGDGDGESNIEGMTLRVEAEHGYLGKIECNNMDCKRGDKICDVYSAPNEYNEAKYGLIIIKLTLMTASKKLARVEDYMTIESKTLDDLGEEKDRLYYILESEFEKKEGYFNTSEDLNEQIVNYSALLSTLFNMVSSPYTKYSSIASIQTRGEVLLKTNPQNIFTNQPDTVVQMDTLIRLALAGYDVTKEYTVIGATAYYGNNSYYSGVENADEYIEKRDNLRFKMATSNRIYGLPDDEYRSYLGITLEKKLNEVIYELNIDKYVRGIQEYEEKVLSKFRKAKDTIIDYYQEGKFLEDCGGLTPENLRAVSSIIKSNVVHDIDAQKNISEDDETEEVIDVDDTTVAGANREITDEFVLTANANYIVKWTWTYTVNAEGDIISDVKCEYKAIRNY